MEFKDIVVDNDAIVNTEPKELPEEAHDIPQGVKPHLNPNPGYGEDGKTVPAIKTDLVEGERGTPVDVVTEPRPAFKTVQEIYNFLNGIKIKGKNVEDYIDSKGGVTEEELQDAVADLEGQISAIPSGTKLYNHNISLTLKTSTLTLYVNGNITSTDSKQITGNFGSGNYFIVSFNTNNIIGFLGGGSAGSYDLQVSTSDGNQYIIQLIGWGVPNYGFGSEHVKTYGGGSYFGNEKFTDGCSLTDTVTEL